MGRRLWWLLCALLGGASLGGCDADTKDDETASKSDDDDDGGRERAVEDDADFGPTVTITGGQLRAGSRCHDVPRIRPNELRWEPVSLGAFEIDKYPYPNDPGTVAKLNVSWADAKRLCKERGKRLCTEMEWERACKGDANTTYLWGDAFAKKRCPGQKDHMIGQRADCKTSSGVSDMLGIALEWTASDWERGTPTGDKVVRGARAEKVSWLSARCTHSRKRDPNATFDNVGFRCCSGEPNAERVVMTQRRATTITKDAGVDADVVVALMKGLPSDHRRVPGAVVTFDRVYRWHPVANEEMVVARWQGRPKDGDPWYEIAVFKLCGERGWLAAKMRGPVAHIGNPKVGTNARKLSFDVKTDRRSDTVKLSYWHGTVKLIQPAWVKKGNQLKVKGDTRLRFPKLKVKK